MKIIKLTQEIPQLEKDKELTRIRNKFPDSEPLGKSPFIRVSDNAQAEDFSGFKHVCNFFENVPDYPLCSREICIEENNLLTEKGLSEVNQSPLIIAEGHVPWRTINRWQGSPTGSLIWGFAT